VILPGLVASTMKTLKFWLLSWKYPRMHERRGFWAYVQPSPTYGTSSCCHKDRARNNISELLKDILIWYHIWYHTKNMISYHDIMIYTSIIYTEWYHTVTSWYDII
jgi:hypothetical protein